MKKNLFLFLSLLSLCFVTISCSKEEEKDYDLIGMRPLSPQNLAFYVSFQDEDGNDLLRERLAPYIYVRDEEHDLNAPGVLERSGYLGLSHATNAGIIYYRFTSLPLPKELETWSQSHNVIDIGHDLLMFSLDDIFWGYVGKTGKYLSLNDDYHFTITFKSKPLFGDDDTHTFNIGYHFIEEGLYWKDYDYDITFDNKKCEVDAQKDIPGSPYFTNGLCYWGGSGKREVTIILPKDK